MFFFLSITMDVGSPKKLETGDRVKGASRNPASGSLKLQGGKMGLRDQSDGENTSMSWLLCGG